MATLTESRRAVFFGTGDIAIPAFRALQSRPTWHLAALVTQPDKPAGRGHGMRSPQIAGLARDSGIPVWQPGKAAFVHDDLVRLAPDLMVVMAYGQILPTSLLGIPRLACWNLHASLLPRHRGASPIQAALLAGDAETGVTVMHVVRELDAGDIVLAKKTPIHPGETGGQLHDRLAPLAAEALASALDALEAGHPPRTPQDPALVTVLGKLSREDGRLDWNQPADSLERMIRAFDPWPGAFTTLPKGDLLKIFPPVRVIPFFPHPSTADPGLGNPADAPPAGTLATMGPPGPRVACRDGWLLLGEVQAGSRRRMPVDAFLRGFPVPEGSRLGSA